MKKEAYFTPDSIGLQSGELLSQVSNFRSRHEIDFKPKTSALLVLDMQNYFLKDTSHAFIPSAEAIIVQIQSLLRAYSTFGLPIIFTRHLNSPRNAGLMTSWWQDLIHGDDNRSEIISGLNSSLGKEIISLRRKGIKATQFVGVVRVGEVTLQILPKIDYHSQGDADAPLHSNSYDKASSSATTNLLFLLSYAQDLHVYEKDIASLSHQSMDWFEFLTHLLALDLHRLMQRGLAHNYILIEDTLPVMRGRWRNRLRATSRSSNGTTSSRKT